MVKNETLSKFMLEEHGKILILLEDFKKNAKSSDAADYFKKLRWKQENHVLAEEKAIMILTKEGEMSSKLKSTMLTILKQHDDLRDLIKKIQDKLQRNFDHYEENIKTFLELMKIHINLENKSFYPVLDKELDDKQKKVMLTKIREIIIGNIRA